MVFVTNLLLLGLFLIPTFLYLAYQTLLHRKMENTVMIIPAVSDKSCKTPHTWLKTSLKLPNKVNAKAYTICTTCGYISGTEHRLNALALTRLSQKLEIAKSDQENYEKLRLKRQVMMDESMNRIIKENVQNFEGDLHKNIENLQQVFRKSFIEFETIYSNLADKDDN
jgi:hypothetical protein